MKEFILPLFVFVLAILSVGVNTVSAQGTGTGDDAQDCKGYGVDYKQTEGLTKEEIVRIQGI